MFKLPDFPKVDFPSIDFPSIDFSALDLDALRNFDFAKYVPAVKFPTIDLPSPGLPAVDVSKLTDAVRDAAYLTVGIGVTAVEQAQARSRELATNFNERLDAAKIQVDTVVDKFEAILPHKAAAVFGQARELTDAAREQVLGLLRTNA
jgi:hypothetical protein